MFRFGTKLGSDPVLEDMMWASLTDKLPNLPMGVTAENLAEKYSLTREEVDAFALRSQTSWGKANEVGVFKVSCSTYKFLLSSVRKVLIRLMGSAMAAQVNGQE